MSYLNPRDWPAPAPGRVSARECVRNAQDEMNKAWQETDMDAAVIFVRGAVDWLRRGLEQMTVTDPVEAVVKSLGGWAYVEGARDEVLPLLRVWGYHDIADRIASWLVPEEPASNPTQGGEG